MIIKNQRNKVDKRKYFLITVSTLFIIVALLLWLIFSKLNKPNTSTVTIKQAQNSSPIKYNIDLTPTLISGKYISFDHPLGLPLKTTALVSPISVESFNFYVKDVYSWTMIVDVSNLPGGDITKNASYSLRKDTPSQYSELNEVINKQTYYIFTDNSFSDGFSKTAFVVHGNLIASISLIGNDTKGTQPLKTTFNMVLNSLTWL